MRRLDRTLLISTLSIAFLALTAVATAGCDGDTSAATDADANGGGTTADVGTGDTAGSGSSDRSPAADAVSGATPCTPQLCDDGNPCTDDSCSAVGSCLHALTANGTPCGCDEEGLCSDGSCRGDKQVCTSHLECDDLLSCTVDLCVGGCACSNEPLTDCVEGRRDGGGGPVDPPGPDPDPRGRPGR